MMNDLERYFRRNEGRLIHKWVHYFAIYDRYFSRYRGTDVVILEIGVSQGGSLQMWRDYFGPSARIYGIDIDPRCKGLEEAGTEILIGSQSDRRFLREVRKQVPPIDILIDDGGHTMRQQIVTFEELFPHVKCDGIYLCEDLHTSYVASYGGGLKRCGTFIEYSKNFIDYLNARSGLLSSHLGTNAITRTVEAIHYYESVLVIEKSRHDEPSHAEATGHPSLPEQPHDRVNIIWRIYRRLRRITYKSINLVLSRLRIRGFDW